MLILQKAAKSDYPAIKKIYIRAFPSNERAPFFFIRRKAQQGKAEMLSIKKDSAVIGFTYLVAHRDLLYLFFLALADRERGKGYGSWTLQKLQEMYSGKRIFLSRETLDKSAENYPERVSRRDFYIRNGFADMGCQVREADVTYDVMAVGGRVTAKEYDELICAWCGNLVKNLIRMNLIEQESRTADRQK